MCLILQLETSTTTCSVALALNGEPISLVQKTEQNIHASSITIFIQEALHSAKIELSDLDAVAVSMGPGSYTGLRIGVSTAKGICFGLDIPLIGINSLEAMTHGFKKTLFTIDKNTLFCPMIDARRMEVYTALYSDMECMMKTSALIIDHESFKKELENHKIYFFGDGAKKCEPIIGLNPNARVIDDFENSASYLSSLSYNKFIRSEFENLAYFEPFYLKDYLIK